MEGRPEIDVISAWFGPWPNGKAVFETWNNKAELPHTSGRLLKVSGLKRRMSATRLSGFGAFLSGATEWTRTGADCNEN